MKVLMISGDMNLLKEGSDAYARLALQRAAVEQLDVRSYRGFWSAVPGFIGVMSAVLSTRYDVVTVQEPFFRGLLALWAARLNGAHLNIQVHADLRHFSFPRRVLAKMILRNADSVRGVSEHVAGAVRALGVQARMTVLPVFIEAARFRALEREPHAGHVILWLGRFEQEKDPALAIEILKEVHAQLPQARMIMLGNGSLEQELREKGKGMPIEFPGWSDPATYLPQADVVLSTSRAESYGASIVEALAAGVPVVAPDVGIAREAGAIVVPREELAHAVVEALGSGARGELKITPLSQEEWAAQWRQSL